MTTDETTDPHANPIYSTPLAADEIAEADAICSLVKLPPDDRLRGSLCRAIRRFVANVTDVARIGWRTRDDELWIDVLSRIASSPAEAAAVVAEHVKKGILPLSSWAGARYRVTESFLCEIGFHPPDIANLSPEDAAVVITCAYATVSEQARLMLKQAGTRSRGRSSDSVLEFFIFTIADAVTMRTKPEPGALIEAVGTALMQAVNRARTKLGDLDGKAREIAVRKLDGYYDLGDDALRKRIDALLADMNASQGSALDANRPTLRLTSKS